MLHVVNKINSVMLLITLRLLSLLATCVGGYPLGLFRQTKTTKKDLKIFAVNSKKKRGNKQTPLLQPPPPNKKKTTPQNQKNTLSNPPPGQNKQLRASPWGLHGLEVLAPIALAFHLSRSADLRAEGPGLILEGTSGLAFSRFFPPHTTPPLACSLLVCFCVFLVVVLLLFASCSPILAFVFDFFPEKFSFWLLWILPPPVLCFLFPILDQQNGLLLFVY